MIDKDMKYIWKNRNKDEVIMTVNEFKNYSGLSSSETMSILNRKRKSSRDWFCNGPLSDPYLDAELFDDMIQNVKRGGKFKKDVFLWENVDTYERLYLTRNEFKEKYGACSSNIIKAINGERPSVCGYRVVKK